MDIGIFFLIQLTVRFVTRCLIDNKPETTFGLLAEKVGGMTFWKQMSQAFPPLSLSLFSSLFFSCSLPSRCTPLSERLEQARQ